MTELRKYFLYRIWDILGVLLYIGKNTNGLPDSRIAAHRKSWWGYEISKIETVLFETEAALNEAEVRAIQNENPKYNKIHNGQPEEVSEQELVMDEFKEPKFPQGDWGIIKPNGPVQTNKPLDVARWNKRKNGALVLTLGLPLPVFTDATRYVAVRMDFQKRQIAIYEVPPNYPNAMTLRVQNGSETSKRYKYRQIIFTDQNPFSSEDISGMSAQYSDPEFPNILFLNMPTSFKSKGEHHEGDIVKLHRKCS